MDLIDNVLQYSSVSVAGMAKNTGKTETLNYLLRHMSHTGRQVAVTSIGVDGESVDSVTATAKPEIVIYKDMFFTTGEKHYRGRTFTSEIYNISSYSTALGRLITARAVTGGKVLLSGPTHTAQLQQLIAYYKQCGTHITLVDGALSRLSIASPMVTDALILATGAAVSANINKVVSDTMHVYNMINLPQVSADMQALLLPLTQGLFIIDEQGKVHNTGIMSALALGSSASLDMPLQGGILFVSGAVTNQLVNYLRVQPYVDKIVLVARDFTKIFITPDVYHAYVRKGGVIKVLHKSKLLAITVNPVSPMGYRLPADALKQALQQVLAVPVYNVRDME